MNLVSPVIQDTIKFLPDYLSASKNNTGGEDLFILFQKLLIAILIGILIIKGLGLVSFFAAVYLIIEVFF